MRENFVVETRMRHCPPYSQQFRFEVKPEFLGLTLIDFFSARFRFRDRDYWIELIHKGQITVNHQGVDEEYVLQQGDVVHTVRHDVHEPDVADDIQVLFEGNGLLVINKPAPLPVHPSGRYFKNTLIHILKETRIEEKFHTIHRLDSWTTGVLVLGLEREAARFVHLQVERQEIEKEYAVMACGDFGDEPFFVDEALGRLEGAHRGFGDKITEAQKALTWFAPVVTKNGVTLLKSVPITGRTNQIRVHVQAAGGYVLNDPLYSPQKPESPPFMGLHCRAMEFVLAAGHQKQRFEADWPEHYQQHFSQEDFLRFAQIPFKENL